MYDNTSKLLINQFCIDFTEWLIKMQFAEMFQDDPQFEDMLKDIQTYRQEIEIEDTIRFSRY
jgi:hypothetical protein